MPPASAAAANRSISTHSSRPSGWWVVPIAMLWLVVGVVVVLQVIWVLTVPSDFWFLDPNEGAVLTTLFPSVSGVPATRVWFGTASPAQVLPGFFLFVLVWNAGMFGLVQLFNRARPR
jgi:hypothetical protein